MPYFAAASSVQRAAKNTSARMDPAPPEAGRNGFLLGRGPSHMLDYMFFFVAFFFLSFFTLGQSHVLFLRQLVFQTGATPCTVELQLFLQDGARNHTVYYDMLVLVGLFA